MSLASSPSVDKKGSEEGEKMLTDEVESKESKEGGIVENGTVEEKHEKNDEGMTPESADTSKASSRAGSPDKKVILLNPVLSTMFKSPPLRNQLTATKMETETKPEESVSLVDGKGDIDKKTETSGVPGPSPKKHNSEFLKASLALAAALKSEPKKKVFCSNTNCNVKTDTLYDVSSNAKIYFGMRSATNQKVCLTCFKKAELFNQLSKQKLVNKENLFDLKCEIQTTSSDAMVDLDTPPNSPVPSGPNTFGENGRLDSQMTEDLIEVDDAMIDEIVSSLLAKIDIQGQMAKCTESVKSDIDDLGTRFSELDVNLDKLNDQISSVSKLYNEKIAVKPRLVEIGSIDMDARGTIRAKPNVSLANLQGLTRTVEKTLKKHMAELSALDNSLGAVHSTLDHPLNMRQPNSVPPLPGPAPGINTNRRVGKLIFVKPKEGQDVYAMHKHSLCYWLPAKILKISQGMSANRPTLYTVQFQQKIKPRSKSSDDSDAYIKEVSGKQLAFKKPSTVTLPVGTRIIGKFKDLLNTDAEVDGFLYAGIIAEVPREINKMRYLVFFDDGYAQYVARNEVFPVVESSPDVWQDVHKNSQEFIREYVMTFPNRHMIRAEIGTSFTVELNGQWLVAKIVDVDSSLLKMQYLKRTDGVEYEWIYRGSTRLGPLYNRLKTLQARPTITVARRHTYAPRGNNFSFEVNRDNDDAETNKVAKKHTGFDGAAGGNKGGMIRAKNGMMISTQMESEGNMVKIQIPRECPSPRPYTPHTCSVKCGHRYIESNYRRVSPLAIPFYLGWARELSGTNRNKVFYHTPCGIRLGTYIEIHTYITRTQSEIPIDFFSLEANIDCLNEFEPLRRIEYLKDISYGKEWTPVTCVNSLDHDLPSYMEYITARIPGKGVKINNDDNFLVCCDCEDDCQNKEKCACWQMTMSGVSFKLAAKEGIQLQGYENRRLKNHVLSGIYECNRKCKCRSTCFNRVVQNKVKWPIQMFKTYAKGWGVRALHDMPQGSFICVYTGQLLTDAGANASGIEVGDEYLAELDFIECNEQIKEDYESECTDIENEEPGTKSAARMAAKMNGNGNGNKHVAKKATTIIQKAVKSTGGVKRKCDDSGNVSDATTTSVTSQGSNSSRPTGPTARKSGSKNGATGKGDKSKSAASSSGVPSPANSTSSGGTIGAGTRSKASQLAASKEDTGDSDDDDIQIYSSFSASVSAKDTKNAPRLPLREYFGKDEAVYIMDAKSMGNFGRYLNHSCDPNVFVQNLFVDTHDPRFPWVAFFTKKDVKAGTELTWDYNYDIGSVPGKTLYCYCLMPDCRGRLL